MVNMLLLLGAPSKDRPHHSPPHRCSWASYLFLVLCYAAAGCLFFQLLTFIVSCLVEHQRIPLVVTKHPSQHMASATSQHQQCPVDYAGQQVDDDYDGPNDFIIYRSIGNDLPPRHMVSQSYNNVKFILEHEPNLPGLDKGWIINKIANKTEEQRIVRLLESYGHHFVVIPLDIAEAEKVPIHYDGFHFHDPIRRNLNVGKGLRATMYRASVIDHMYRDKNVYVINNNGARNTALEAGIWRGYKWILPWDGNCFLTASAWKAMREVVIAKANCTKYFHVPMARVQNNNLLFDAEYCPEAVEEPQLIFHRDAKARFSINQRYGRRPKVDMIMRLGIPGPWDEYVKFSSPYFETPYSYTIEKDVGPDPVPAASWVARLYSGRGTQEVATKDSADLRKLARCQGVRLLLDQVDAMAAEEVHGFNSKTLLVWNLTVLEAEKAAFQTAPGANPELTALIGQVVHCADNAASVPPMRGEDITPPGPVHVNLDTYDQPGEMLPKSRLSGVLQNTTCLALAHYFTGKRRYAVMAVRNLAAFFMDDDTAITPEALVEHMFGAEEEGPLDIVGSIEMRDFFYFADAVKLVALSGILTEDEFALLQRWFQQYVDIVMWRTEGSMLGLQAGVDGFDGRSMGPRGINYDVQMAAVAALAGNTTLFMHYIKSSRARLQQQFALREAPNPYPNMPNQYYGAIRFNRTNVVEDLQWGLRQVVPWFVLASMGRRVDHDLFHYAHADTPHIPILRAAAALWIPGFRQRYLEDIPKDDVYYRKMSNFQKRLHTQYTPELHMAAAYLHYVAVREYPDLAAVNVPNVCQLYKCDEGPFEVLGVPPFWNVGFSDEFLVKVDDELGGQ